MSNENIPDLLSPTENFLRKKFISLQNKTYISYDNIICYSRIFDLCFPSINNIFWLSFREKLLEHNVILVTLPSGGGKTYFINKMKDTSVIDGDDILPFPLVKVCQQSLLFRTMLAKTQFFYLFMLKYKEPKYILWDPTQFLKSLTHINLVPSMSHIKFTMDKRVRENLKCPKCMRKRSYPSLTLFLERYYPAALYITVNKLNSYALTVLKGKTKQVLKLMLKTQKEVVERRFVPERRTETTFPAPIPVKKRTIIN